MGLREDGKFQKMILAVRVGHGAGDTGVKPVNQGPHSSQEYRSSCGKASARGGIYVRVRRSTAGRIHTGGAGQKRGAGGILAKHVTRHQRPRSLSKTGEGD